MLNLDMYAASPPAALPSPATPRAAASGVTRRLRTRGQQQTHARTHEHTRSGAEANRGRGEWLVADVRAARRQPASGAAPAPRRLLACAAHAQKVDVVVGVEARQLLGRGRVRLVNLQPAVQPVREDQVVRQPAEERGGGARGWLRPTAPRCCAAGARRPWRSRAALLAATKGRRAAPPHALEPHGLHRVPRPVVVVAHIRAVVIGDAPLRRHGGGVGPRRREGK